MNIYHYWDVSAEIDSLPNFQPTREIRSDKTRSQGYDQGEQERKRLQRHRRKARRINHGDY